MRVLITLILASFIGACSSKSKTPAPMPPPSADHPANKSDAPGTKAVGTPASTAKLSCSHKADVRTLEVRTKGQGCELGYTKSGQEAVVATSRSGSTHCENSMSKIKGRLEEAGFSCK